MRADTIEPGDVLTDRDGATVYTVLTTRPLDGEIVVGVRYTVDGGTGLRYFARDQDVPLTRWRDRVQPCPEPSEPSDATLRGRLAEALRPWADMAGRGGEPSAHQMTLDAVGVVREWLAEQGAAMHPDVAAALRTLARRVGEERA